MITLLFLKTLCSLNVIFNIFGIEIKDHIQVW